MLGAFGVYSFVYPFAILLMSFDWMPFGMEWMSSLLLVLLGLSCVGWLWANYGTRGLTVAALLFVLGVGLEYMGVLTGFPFGSYRYTGVLVPELPGGVPFAMGFAWLLIVISGSFTASRLVLPGSRSAARVVALSLLGALFAVGLDLLLEPVAYHVKGYWQWLAGSGGYYDIPWSNFVAWFVAAAIFAIPLGAAVHCAEGLQAHLVARYSIYNERSDVRDSQHRAWLLVAGIGRADIAGWRVGRGPSHDEQVRSESTCLCRGQKVWSNAQRVFGSIHRRLRRSAHSVHCGSNDQGCAGPRHALIGHLGRAPWLCRAAPFACSLAAIRS